MWPKYEYNSVHLIFPDSLIEITKRYCYLAFLGLENYLVIYGIIFALLNEGPKLVIHHRERREHREKIKRKAFTVFGPSVCTLCVLCGEIFSFSLYMPDFLGCA